MRLHLLAQVGDHALCGLGEHLGEGVGTQPLNDGSAENRQNQRLQILNLVLADDVVEEIFSRGRQNQSSHAVHRDQGESQEQQRTLRTHEHPGFGQHVDQSANLVKRCAAVVVRVRHALIVL